MSESMLTNETMRKKKFLGGGNLYYGILSTGYVTVTVGRSILILVPGPEEHHLY